MASCLSFGLFALSSCGDSGRPDGLASNDSSLVGGPCLNNSECDLLLCQGAPIAPGGTCTISCGSSNSCPSGSSCVVTTLGWLCLLDCVQTDDCRSNYECQQEELAPPPETGRGPTTSVCIGP